MRGITSSVNILWITVYNYRPTILRIVENVTANLVDNSTVYTDQLVTQPLSINDNGRVYYCGVSIKTTFGFSFYGGFILNFIGMYISISV